MKIIKQIEELARSYTPEWNFSTEDPDIGSVLAMIFAGQMEENIGRYGQVLEKYHTEFVNMLDITPLPARPAQGLVQFTLLQDTVPGARVARGTKLLAEADTEEGTVIFETDHNLYVTNAVFEAAFLTDGTEGYVTPLLGEFQRPELLQQPALLDKMAARQGIRAFRLFGETDTITRNALLFYHPTIFDTQTDPLYVRIVGCEALVREIVQGKFVFLYYDGQGVIPFQSVHLMEDGITFSLCREEGGTQGFIVLEATGTVKETYHVEDICFSAKGGAVPADFAGNGSTDFDVQSFNPFGEVLSLYQECYIGSNHYFGKAGAQITVSFDVSFPEHLLQVSTRQEESSLKIIKRKPRVINSDTPAESYAEEISIEYFNGIGWKRLEFGQEHRHLFAQGEKGRYTLSFICPPDWQETEAGAYQGRCLRLQLLKSDNCYLRPGRHHYPHLENLRIAYSYEGKYVGPKRLEAIVGTHRYDYKRYIDEMRGYDAFTLGVYGEDALYLGFRRPMKEGPVSILFQLEQGIRCDGVRCRFEYSTANGFKQLKVLDQTENFSHTGVVMFLPQSDMAQQMIEGKRLYWIRVCRIGKQEEKSFLPKICDIRLNVIPVSNIETRREEEFYIDEVGPNLRISLGAANILDVELWVNEYGSISRREQEQLLKQSPECVRAEYDILGNLSAFYVRWEETERLDGDGTKRCYMLDRLNRELIFGDGIHVYIPRVLNDVAFRLTMRCCDGSAGNVPAHGIYDVLENIKFLDHVGNPMQTFGGSDMENLEDVLERGANIICSRKRLVSLHDYAAKIKKLSDNIAKVHMVPGQTREGRQDTECVTAVLLLKDYTDGSYSFQQLSGEVKRQLLKSCELTIVPEQLHITEPIFVKISVDVWAGSVHMDDSFEIQDILQECLADFLDPVKSEDGRGWEIGTLPRRSQILMKLDTLKSKVIVRETVIVARYTDESGSYEMDLEEVYPTPFMVCCSGEHRVHMMLAD